MKRLPFFRWVIFLVALLLACPAFGQQPSVEQCFFAYEETQVQMKDQHLTQALELATQCSQGCPEEISQQCQIWGRQLERDTPSVLLVAQYQDGKDPANVSATIDGTPSELQKELVLDPGSHTIVFQRPDGWEEVLEVTIYRGEKRRPIQVSVPPLLSPKVDLPPPPPKRRHAVRNWAIVSFAVGGAGIGGAIAGTAWAIHQKNNQLEDCKPNCTTAEVRRVKTALVLADVSAIIGAVGVATGVALVVWGNRGQKQQPRATLMIAPTGPGATSVFSYSF